jgi:hypothetical protein
LWLLGGQELCSLLVLFSGGKRKEFFYFCLFFDTGSYSVGQAGLKLRGFPSWVLGSQVHPLCFLILPFEKWF